MTGDLFANPLHLVILLVVVLIIFGPGKLPGVGAALGKSVREFKKATTEDDRNPDAPPTTAFLTAAAPASATSASTALCPTCGHENPAASRFCSGCGATLMTPAETVAEPAEAESPAADAEPAPAVAAAPAQCPDCQTENPPASRFCAHCGKLLGLSTPPVEAPSA